jgi:hypothetical protein
MSSPAYDYLCRMLSAPAASSSSLVIPKQDMVDHDLQTSDFMGAAMKLGLRVESFLGGYLAHPYRYEAFADSEMRKSLLAWNRTYGELFSCVGQPYWWYWNERVDLVYKTETRAVFVSMVGAHIAIHRRSLKVCKSPIVGKPHYKVVVDGKDQSKSRKNLKLLARWLCEVHPAEPSS